MFNIMATLQKKKTIIDSKNTKQKLLKLARGC